MFNLKKEKRKLSEKTNAMRKELMGARCLFEMDQFVKLSEVKSTMKEALMSIVDKMQKADDLAKANASTITRLESKIKAVQTAMSVVRKVENNQDVLFKWKSEHSLKLIDNEALMKDVQTQLEFKIEGV